LEQCSAPERNPSGIAPQHHAHRTSDAAGGSSSDVSLEAFRANRTVGCSAHTLGAAVGVAEDLAGEREDPLCTLREIGRARAGGVGEQLADRTLARLRPLIEPPPLTFPACAAGTTLSEAAAQPFTSAVNVMVRPGPKRDTSLAAAGGEGLARRAAGRRRHATRRSRPGGVGVARTARTGRWIAGGLLADRRRTDYTRPHSRRARRTPPTTAGIAARRGLGGGESGALIASQGAADSAFDGARTRAHVQQPGARITPSISAACVDLAAAQTAVQLLKHAEHVRAVIRDTSRQLGVCEHQPPPRPGDFLGHGRVEVWSD
jgi:hypothetical protein